MSKINDDLMEDAGDEMLKGIMGGRFQDMSEAGKAGPKPKEIAPKAFPSVTTSPSAPRNDSGSRQAGQKLEGAVDAAWKPVKAATAMEKLKSCGKWALLFGGISALLFWWQQAGLLDPKAAVPSFIFIALLTGMKIGRCMTRG